MVLGDRIERARYHNRMRDRHRQLALFRVRPPGSFRKQERDGEAQSLIATAEMPQASGCFSFLVVGICRCGLHATEAQMIRAGADIALASRAHHVARAILIRAEE